jgi:hypothetical protein
MMQVKSVSLASRILLAAGLVFGAVAAQAAGGITIEKSQEGLVRLNMSTADVQQALGRPSRNIQYGNEPGPTFSYHVLGTEETLFEVDFGGDGKVVSVDERLENLGGDL